MPGVDLSFKSSNIRMIQIALIIKMISIGNIANSTMGIKIIENPTTNL